MYKIKIIPSNLEFTSNENTNILASALNQQINLPHACKNGNCGSCKAKIVSGEISLDTNYSKTAVSSEELLNNYTLLCKSFPLSDLVIEITTFNNIYPIKTLPSKVLKIIKINNTAILQLKLPPSQVFDYAAGQYIDIILNGKNRSYSMASSPDQLGLIELHVRYHVGGVFSELVWNQLQENQILRFKGPLGSFKLQNTNNPVLLVCTGTGFAPIKAIIQDMIANNINRSVHLFWGNRTINDFYLLELLTEWKTKLSLDITLCLSLELSKNYVLGYVTSAVSAQYSDLSNYEIYACGNINMIKDIYHIATNKLNLKKTNFFSDAFTPSI